MPLMQAELLVLSEDPVEVPHTVTVENKKIIGESNAVLFVGANLLKRPDVSKLFIFPY